MKKIFKKILTVKFFGRKGRKEVKKLFCLSAALSVFFAPAMLCAKSKSSAEGEDIILAAPSALPAPSEQTHSEQETQEGQEEAPAEPDFEKPSLIRRVKPSPAPRYPSSSAQGGKKRPEAGKIKGYVSDVSHSKGMVEKEMNPEESAKLIPKTKENAFRPIEVISANAMNDASDAVVKEALGGSVPDIAPPPPRPLKRSNLKGERDLQRWFSLTKGQRELRDLIYPIVPAFLKACPSWDAQLSGWTACKNAIPEQKKFEAKLKQEPRSLQIQQWFFLNEVADIGGSEDDIIRAQTFLARFFAEMAEDQLQREGWCYGPSWVVPSEQSWMACTRMPLRESRPDSGWEKYRKPENAPKPLWPIPAR